MGRVTYAVRLRSLTGALLGYYRHPGLEEPKRGMVLSQESDLIGGPWRVRDYAQTDLAAPAKNVLIVEPAGS